MKSGWKQSLVALAAAVLSLSVWAQDKDFARIQLSATKIAPNLYTLSGPPGLDPTHSDAAGGRIGVFTGPDGIFMIDSQYPELSDKVLAAVRQISAGPIRFLVNTHIHGDHTGGDAFFAKMGVTIIAREELRDEMLHPRSGNGTPGPAADPAALPAITYGLGNPVKLHLNGEVIDLIGVRAAHTGGDTIIRFENANVIFIGDFYRDFGYPFIDRGNGGSLQGMLDGCDQLMEIAGPDTTLIPGHGDMIKRDKIVPYKAMILGVRAKVQAMINQGKSEKEVVASNLTAPYDTQVPGGDLTAGNGQTSAQRFVMQVYQELKGSPR
jgi:glyoxylase-like metal-dependent hydrolase (beta-lactamase superfamily II)